MYKKSIFDLPTEQKDLQTEALSRLQFDQLAPTRDVTGSNFSNGTISFKWETSGTKWCMLNKSYLRTRMSISKVGGAQLDNADGIAPNMDLMPNLFQSCQFNIQDKTVSRIPDFVPQIDALENRLMKSKAWIDSVGNSTNFWQSSQPLRQAQVTSDGTVVNQNAVNTPDVTTTRTGMLFDPAGGAGAGERNSWAYDNATGVLTYARGTAAAGLTPAAASAAYPLGSYFKYVGVAGTPEVEMKVLSNNGAGVLVVEPLLNADVAADGGNNFAKVEKGNPVTVPSRRVEFFETTWTPPLSVFKIEHAFPCGRYQLDLMPQTSTAWKKRAIESVFGGGDKNAGVDYDVNIVDMYLYVQTLEGSSVDNMEYLLDLEEVRCQSEKIENSSFGQKNVDVSPSTYAVTVAYQDVRCGENSQISASKFKVYDAAIANSVEQNLTRMFISFSGVQLPSPDADPLYEAKIDYTTERYLSNLIHSGAYFDAGGSETIEEWGKDRGSYYYFKTPRDGKNRDTRLTVKQGFKPTTDVSNMRLLMFDHHRKIARIRIQSGRVVDVQLEDA